MSTASSGRGDLTTRAGDCVQAEYLIETPHDLEFAAERLAAVTGAGTFTSVPGETAELRERFAVHVSRLQPLDGPEHRALVTLSIPLEITGTELTTLLATVAGGVFGLREVSGVRLVNLNLPQAFGDAHPGPQFGVQGTRRLTAVAERPIIASIIKPNVGLTPQQTACTVRSLAEAGVDFVKDDEKMTSPPYSVVSDRVAAIMRVVNEHADKTGKRVMYAFNISHADPEIMVCNHDAVVRAGGNCVMVSVCQVGLGGLTFLRRRCQTPIHAHRNGWDAWTRCPRLGWDFLAWQQILRLAGVDHLHVNGIRNRYWEDDDSVVRSIEACLAPMYGELDRLLPVIGSGMWAGQVPETWRRTRTTDVMYIAGGGIQGHPDGPGAGVRSIRQAWDAAIAGIPLAEYATPHQELRRAMESFG